MAFWLFMGAYVFNFNPTGKSMAMGYTAVWFSLIGLISASIVASSVSYSVYYGSSSLAYAFRYTKLKPASYVLDLLGGTSIVVAILGTVLLLCAMVVFSMKSKYSIYPAMPLQSILVFFLAGMFMFLVSVVFVILINNYVGLRNVTFVAYVPQILSYIFGFSEFGVPLPANVVYASPFSEIPRLLFQTFYGSAAPLNISSGTGPALNPYLLLSGLLVWIALLLLLALILVRRITPRSIEEARQV
ncbi:MAG: hypothetical protein QW812_06460 [Thermoplasmataceae archaeon]